MVGDGKPKGARDRMLPCAAQHRFAMANIINRMGGYPFT